MCRNFALDRSTQRRTVTTRQKDNRMLTPQERSEAARRRILKAAENVPGSFPGFVGKQPISAVAFALLGGFVIGYSPRVKRVFMNNVAGLLRFLGNLKL